MSVTIEIEGRILRLQGDVDVRNTALVRDALYGLLDLHGEIVVDLSDVITMDLTGLRMLAVATRRAAQQGGHVTLRGCRPTVRRLLHLSHLIRVVEIEKSGAPRLRHLSGTAPGAGVGCATPPVRLRPGNFPLCFSA